MQFFRYSAIVANEDWDALSNDRQMEKENVRKLAMKSADFNRESKRIAFYFVKDTTETEIVIGIMTRDPRVTESRLASFLSALGLVTKAPSLEEVTLEHIDDMLTSAERRGYIRDAQEVRRDFELNHITRRFGQGYFDEFILEKGSRNEIYALARKYMMEETFTPELDRIWAEKQNTRAGGHPVHYMIETDDPAIRDDISVALLQALYENQRFINRRYPVMPLSAEDQIGPVFGNYWYKCNTGGAVIIDCKAGEETEDELASAFRNQIEEICGIMKKHCNQVLTVFRFPRECSALRAMFLEYLGDISFIELKESFAYNGTATAFLRKLASASGIRANKALLSKIEPDKGYLVPDLRRIYDEWYNKRLKTDIYPQHREVTSVRNDAVRTKPKGNAYDELAEMIGLAEAKKVINQALNYYKAVRAFGSRGLKDDKPAMHMVFTGNPGTAKTTAARLFARIMKDNGLLSKGDLIEVGRSDLVGKYVGWTAPTVKRKFKEAKGSVLFIDEAYSLVDDRGGSYGDEAINTIVQEMENHRDDVVVIFAGYPKEMENFLRKNPGLRSRIAFHVPFEDYDTRELCDIAELVARKKGLKLSGDARERLVSVFDAARVSEDFGNGRYVRNVIEKAKMALTNRLVSMDIDSLKDDDIITIRGEDIEMPEEKKQPVRRIGFSA